MSNSRPSRCRAAINRLMSVHDDERGVIAILFLFLSIIFVILVALLWNTGRVISAKMRAQAAADQAAFAAATWNSRALNTVTATNMLILRNASAQISSLAIRHVYEGVIRNWDEALRAAQECPPDPLSNPCLDAYFAGLLLEVGPFAQFVDRCYVEAAHHLAEGTFVQRIIELNSFQTEFLESMPDVIEEQREAIAEFHGMRLILAVPGRTDGFIVPPVRRGDRESFGRMLRERRVTDFLPPGGTDFGRFDAIGQARRLWEEGVELAINEVRDSLAPYHFVLLTQEGEEERSPDAAGRQPFSVMATAIVGGISEDLFFMRGFFDAPVSLSDEVISCAQAETYNIFDEQRVAVGVPSAFPFRVWTTRGWAWQPRLTRCDFVITVMETDAATLQAWTNVGVGEAHRGRIPLILRH